MLGRPRRRAGARAGCRWLPRAAQPMTVAASGSSPTSASTCTALRCKGAVAWFCRRRRRGGGTGTVSASTGSACGAGDTGDAAAAAGGQGVRYSMLSILPSSLVLHFQAYSRMLGPFLPHLRSNLLYTHVATGVITGRCRGRIRQRRKRDSDEHGPHVWPPTTTGPLPDHSERQRADHHLITTRKREACPRV